MSAEIKTYQIALIPSFDGADVATFEHVARVLQKQVNRDFSPTWQLRAKVEFVPYGADYGTRWPIVVTKQYDGLQNSEGIHMHPKDPNQVPFAIVRYTDDGTWSLTASHECLEMLADSSTVDTVRAISPLGDRGEIAKEVCDPVQAIENAYHVDGVLVSDFCTPAYYRQNAPPPYDQQGKVKQQGQVLRNGYLSWTDPKKQGTLFIKENVQLRIFTVPLPGLYMNKFLALDEHGCALFWTIPWCVASKLEQLSEGVYRLPLGVGSRSLARGISQLAANVRARAFGKYIP